MPSITALGTGTVTYWSHNANRRCTVYTAEAAVLELSSLKILVVLTN